MKIIKTIRLCAAMFFLTGLPCLVPVPLMASPGIEQSDPMITLQVKNQKLSDVITEVKKQAEYHFFYNAELGNVKVSAQVENVRIEQLLATVLKDTGIDFKVSGRSVWLTKNVSHKPESRKISQIKGRVTDEQGEPLIGVNVISKNDRKIGTVTDLDGNFELKTEQSSPLLFSYVGYVNTEIPADAKSPMSVRLKSSTLNLNEVVVVGYGTQKKYEVTSAITSIKSDDFVKGAVSSPEQLLRGKVAGLSINTTSGNPSDQGIQIMLRGVSNLSGNQSPLIVIDGIPGGDLAMISPEDIESIDILKDGSAAAIYGTRGTNGVIIVTTKKGSQSQNKISVDYHGYVSYESISNQIDVFSADEFRRLPETTGGKVLSKMTDGGDQVDWFSRISRNPVSHVHNLSIKGGDARSNFIANVNYRDQNGILRGSDKNQLNARIGANHAVLDDRLRFSVNISNTASNSNYVNAGNYFNSLIVNPTFPVKDKTGNYTVFQDAANPVQELMERSSDGKSNIFMINGKVTAEPIERLNISVVGGLQRTSGFGGTYATSDYTNGTVKNGEMWRDASSSDLRTIEAMADYNFSVGDHDVTVLAGYSYQRFVKEGFDMYNYNFPTDMLGYNRPNLGLGLKDGSATMGGNKYQTQLASFFARANYSYKQRYLLSASVRYEGSSKFGPNNKWGVFPAVSAGWRIKEEGFLKDVTWINDLKLRAGYGVTGAEPASPYLSINQYSFGDPILSEGKWIWTVGPYKNANPDLRWETKHEYNVGVDFAFLNNRLNGSVDYYNRTTKDLIYQYNVPVPPNLVSTIWANVGSIRNTGFELLLNGQVVQTKDFSFRLSGNVAYNTNKVLKLSNEMYQRDFLEVGETGHPVQKATHLVKEGQPVGNFWGWNSVGLSADGKSWLVENESGAEGVYGNESDRQVIGNGIPKIFAGLTASLGYKNFDLEISLRGAFMFEILNKYRMLWETFNRGPQFNYPTSVLDKPYGSDNYVSAAPAYVSYYVERGDYGKIDNVCLGYTVPMKSKRYVKNLRFYLSGLNLYTFTGYKGIDPEINLIGLSPGIDNVWNLYPTTRTISFGVQISL